jgi:glucokinase
VTTPVVGIDLGGTKIFGTLVDARQDGSVDVLGDHKRPTPGGTAAEVADAIADVVHALHPEPTAVGIGTPGVVVPGSGTVQYAPNLSGFERPVPLGAMVAERVGAPVAVGNDVNVAALGEAHAGAAVGHRDVLAVWLGTGVGAGLILDGRLRTGPSGLAGELGHTVVIPDGRRCACGGRGHLEAYLGRRALEEEVRELHRAGRPSSLVDDVGQRRMKSSAFQRAYAAGDEITVELVDRGLVLLGIAVANTVVTVDVSAVVIGGGLGERLGEVVVASLRNSLAELRFSGDPPTVVRAALGDHAGAVGAAVLAAASAGGAGGA